MRFGIAWKKFPAILEKRKGKKNKKNKKEKNRKILFSLLAAHTHPSHSQTSRLLTSSLSLGVPVPRPTQCV